MITLKYLLDFHLFHEPPPTPHHTHTHIIFFLWTQIIILYSMVISWTRFPRLDLEFGRGFIITKFCLFSKSLRVHQENVFKLQTSNFTADIRFKVVNHDLVLIRLITEAYKGMLKHLILNQSENPSIANHALTKYSYQHFDMYQNFQQDCHIKNFYLRVLNCFYL